MLIWASQTPWHIHTHTPQHTLTVCFKVGLLTAADSYDLPARKERKKKERKGDCGKKGLVCEANQCIWVAFERSLCQMLHFRSDEEERMNRLIEILSEGTNRKLNNPSLRLLRTKYVVEEFPFRRNAFFKSNLCLRRLSSFQKNVPVKARKGWLWYPCWQQG